LSDKEQDYIHDWGVFWETVYADVVTPEYESTIMLLCSCIDLLIYYSKIWWGKELYVVIHNISCLFGTRND